MRDGLADIINDPQVIQEPICWFKSSIRCLMGLT